MKQRGDWCYRFFFLTGLHFFLALSLKINSLLKDQETLLFLYRPTGLAREVFSFFFSLYLLGAVNTASPEDYLASPIAADYSTSLGIYGREFAKHRGTIPPYSLSWCPSFPPSHT